ncbi:hypothetical protein LSG31_02690 [Fodinisporobacter ferrooxydans]|uniref:Uncharacterized protein n=1 Tax=Fodinisporobacter ferrooxydans TaxID=2901836 RepID=A0ABY4CTH0_9BACL|nr:hypothetical protein LSG31_02690 [Alicyclobacillaceae bacterium MYW30-H2]
MTDDRKERLGEILGQILTPIQEQIHRLEQKLDSIESLRQQLNKMEAVQEQQLKLLQQINQRLQEQSK